MSLVGNLEDLGLGEILQIVSLSRKSGVLTLHSRERQGKIVFRAGQVISASSSSHNSNLGELLIKKGVLNLQQLREALNAQQAQAQQERLGTILIRDYAIPRGAVEEVAREQIEDVCYSLFTWSEGTFDFELRDDVEAVDSAHLDPMQFMLEQGLNPQFLAMEGSRIVDERRHRGELDEHGEELGAAGGGEAAEPDVDLAFDLMSGEAPAAAPAEPPPVPAPVAAVPETVPVPAPAERLLVMVDDDEVVRDCIGGLLSQAGYQVMAYAKSEETLIQVDALHQAGKRATLLVDLVMPKMDGSGVLGGLELLEFLKNNFADLPVLVMADYRSADAERQIRKLGYSCIIKPRRNDLDDAGLVQAFAGRLLPALDKVEAGEQPEALSDKVNIADELRLEMGEELTSEAPRGPQSTGISMLRGMLEELNNPSLGGGIILLVLRFASEFVNRAVVFFVKRDEIAGLGQFGLPDDDGKANERVRNLRIPRSAESVFSRVVASGLAEKLAPAPCAWNERLLAALGGGQPAEAFLGPILSEGKVVAVLYGDNLPEQRPVEDTEALEIFLSQAGLAMEKALLQRRLKGKEQEEA